MDSYKFYLSVDPGITTGFAIFDEKGDLKDVGDVKESKFYEWVYNLDWPRMQVLICEDYLLFAHKAQAQSYSRFPTVRFIGAITYAAWLAKVPIVFQKPDIKNIAYKWAGIMKPKNHDMSHQTDAFVHGVYYLQKKGIRKPQQGRADES